MDYNRNVVRVLNIGARDLDPNDPTAELLLDPGPDFDFDGGGVRGLCVD